MVRQKPQNLQTWALKATTVNIDVRSASVEELEAALVDCERCIAVEYPETIDGTYRALEIMASINDALRARHPEQLADILLRVRNHAEVASRNAHPHAWAHR